MVAMVLEVGGTKIPRLKIIPRFMWFICRKQLLEQRRLLAVNKTVQWFMLANQTKSSMWLSYHKRNMSENKECVEIMQSDSALMVYILIQSIIIGYFNFIVFIYYENNSLFQFSE